MKWRLIGITFFGLLNISTSDMKELCFVVFCLTGFYIAYKLMPEDGYTAEQINRCRNDRNDELSKIE